MKKIAFCTGALLFVFFISHSVRSEPTPIVTPSAGPTPVPGMIRIEVQSIYGQPVSDLKVVIFALEGPDGEELSHCGGLEEIALKSISEVVFQEEFPPGPYRVEATAPGWIGQLREEIVLKAGKAIELKFKLQPGFMISGIVVDDSGIPLSGVELNFWPFRGGSFYSRERKVFSNSEGWFEINTLEKGLYSMRATFPGYMGEYNSDVVAGTDNLRIVLEKGYTIKGVIQGDVDGLGITISLEFRGPKKVMFGTKGWTRRVELDNRHRFVISDIGKGPYSLRLRDGDYISEWVREVEASPDRRLAPPIVLTAYRGGGVSGRVVDKGSKLPIVDAKVSLSVEYIGGIAIEYTDTDETGEFRFQALKAGEYELKVKLWHDSSSKYRLKRKIKVPAGQDLFGLNLEIDPGRRIYFSGRVVDGEGKPVPEAVVKLNYRPEDKSSFQSRYTSGAKTETDAGGNFSLSDYLDEGGVVKFTAQKKGYARTESVAIPLTGERDQIKGIVLELHSGGSLEVEVEDGEGMGVMGAVVELDNRRFFRRESAISFSSRKKLSDSSGYCRFDKLPFIGYTIKICSPDFSPARKEVRLSEEEPDDRIIVTLKAGRDIRVVVKNERGEAIAGAEVTVGNMTDSGGTVILRNQPAATVVIQVKADGYVKSERELVKMDQDRISVILKEAGSIKGRFVNSKQNPLSEVILLPSRDEKGGDGLTYESPLPDRIDELGDGCFRVRNMAPGIYRIIVKSPGLAVPIIEGVEVEAGEETDLGEIQLAPEGMISGRITVEDIESFPEGAWARAEAPGWDGMSPVSIDLNGTYSIKSLPSGDYTVYIGATHNKVRRIRDILLSSGEKKELPVITLEKLIPEEELECKRQRNLVPSLGIRIKETDEGSKDFESLRIDKVMPNSAAEKSGLLPGDTIMKINGNRYSEYWVGFLEGLFGKPGTKLKITVKRGESGREEELDLTVDDWSYKEMLKEWRGE